MTKTLFANRASTPAFLASLAAFALAACSGGAEVPGDTESSSAAVYDPTYPNPAPPYDPTYPNPAPRYDPTYPIAKPSCGEADPLKLSDAHVTAVGGGPLRPGGEAIVHVTMTNEGSSNGLFYPDAVLTSETRGVTGGGSYFLGSLDAGQAGDLTWKISLGSDVPDTLRLRIVPGFMLREHCEKNAITIEALVAP